jgi:hypothetical protein
MLQFGIARLPANSFLLVSILNRVERYQIKILTDARQHKKGGNVMNVDEEMKIIA